MRIPLSLALLCGVMGLWPAYAQEEIVHIVIGESYRDQNKKTHYGMTAEEVINAIYSGAGIKYQITYMPDERAIQSVLTGQFDALDLRISKLGEDHSQVLVKVDVPLEEFGVYAFSVGEQSYLSLNELKDKNVVSMFGSRYVENIKHYHHLKLVYRDEQAALMLMAGRVDVWLAPMQSYYAIKDKFPVIKVVSPPLTKDYLYHYLHISNSYLLDALEASASEFMESVARKPDG
ncbi:transporter substrate-binding domain-containing protein [Vibrio sp. Of14-4]|uniref:substrate-binding periplasmic protein n=1 Tax=Vibrio sp. Of14-4 TaxID=2724878 RepID=UPI001EF181A9|nr:transporter substrate-binding domain-containing protein [Vibrio sp. Of14-4]MCG7490962.1 transporter substrate-binding domain-containing protein [Vibrio sp. Of14-4]